MSLICCAHETRIESCSLRLLRLALNFADIEELFSSVFDEGKYFINQR